jgi:glycosyltransferase involved in cell wall biosynthesis
MKILVVQDYLRSGGTERQSVFLANAFSTAGHPTTLLTFRPGGQLASTVASSVRRVVLQSNDLGLDWFAPGLARHAVREAPDVVLCMGRMANCWADTLRRAFAKRSHAGAVFCTMRTGKKLPWFFRRSLRTCRHIVANSQEARDSLVTGLGLPADKISVIYNSLVFRATTEIRPRRDELRRSSGTSPATAVLLCVAMFRPEKNQRELIEVVTGLPATTDWQLWLAGDGPARAECERLAAAKGIAARVKFLGLQRDPSALYEAADVAVHASWSESLSNFIIEAQAHGLPAVVSAAQGMRECFVPDRTGWEIAPNDREAFRAAVVRLIAEPTDVRAARRHQAQAFARTTFDPARQVQAYLDLFAKLVP